ncbi:MAG: XRE family transcriptional regulator [Gemmatimonadota bacterium]|nr:XRE family transcriptional regulator [Gemmatimonadota bacterium]
MALSPARLSDREIGQRLRVSRQVARLTQADAAEAIQVARTTIVAIEQGRRRIRTRELQELAFRYGTSANAILRKDAVHLDLVPQFRKLSQSGDRATDSAARMLTDLVSAEVELENVLGVDRSRNYPRERPILPGDVAAQAEQDAHDLRVWLGLGAGPVKDIVSLVDLDLGIRVYVRPLEGRISGLFAYEDAVGACMLLNGNHPIGRLAYTVAHELAHFISTRREPGVLRADSSPRSREERYANYFARSFLTPARAVRQRFAELTAGHSHLTRRHVILLAHSFGVSREAMVRRLEELRLARDGTWDWFQDHGGITNKQVEQVLGASPDQEQEGSTPREVVPPRLALLAREAWKKAFYSEGQLARLLKLHRLEVRQLLDGVETEKHEADEFVELPR